jgi:hypothetical protein
MKEENIKVRYVANVPPPDIPETVTFELTLYRPAQGKGKKSTLF